MSLSRGLAADFKLAQGHGDEAQDWGQGHDGKPAAIEPEPAADWANNAGAQVVKQQIQWWSMAFVGFGFEAHHAADDGMGDEEAEGHQGDAHNDGRQTW